MSFAQPAYGLWFEAVREALQTVGTSEEELLNCIRREPKLLLNNQKRLQSVLNWFVESGLSQSETKALVHSYPTQLTRRQTKD